MSLERIGLRAKVRDDEGKGYINEVTLGLSGDVHALCVASEVMAGKLVNNILSNFPKDITTEELRTLIIDSTETIEAGCCSDVVECLSSRNPRSISEIYTRLMGVAYDRYDKLKEAGCKNINEYNHTQLEGSPYVMPQILVIHKDLSCITKDSEAYDAILGCITYLLKVGRFTGVHLVLITPESPYSVLSRDIVNNITARYVFATDAVTSLDLLGVDYAKDLGANQFYVRDISHAEVKKNNYWVL